MKYVRRPIPVDAVQHPWSEVPEWLSKALECEVVQPLEDGTVLVRTSRGVLVARPNDWIVRSDGGSIYPVEHDMFTELYEAIQ